MADTILVKSARTDNRVVLSEKHPDHPGGEVFIAGPTRNKLEGGVAVLDEHGKPVQEDNIIEVAPTPAVLRKLSEKQLVEVNPKATRVANEPPKSGK